VYLISVSEFGLSQEFDSIVLLGVAQSPDKVLNRLILMLFRYIRLGMEGYQEPMVSTEVTTFPGPELASKHAAMI
jgi:hypothetical protein